MRVKHLNAYFVSHPDMILGEMQEVSGPYGMETACIPHEGQSLESLLAAAIGHIQGEIQAVDLDDLQEEETGYLPADPDVRNFSFAVVEGKLYFRENSLMRPVSVSATAEQRIRGLIGIRDCVRKLIEYQTEKYLQYNTLKENDLLHFDAWASTFGETVTAIELAPEGTGYRAKTRFAKFYNLPELMSMFKEIADIQTADMLKLPVPEAEYHNVVLKPSEQQKEIVASLSQRAEKVRNKQVDSNEDNMLVITNDGRKLALDQRLINPMLPDSDTGKVAVCTENVYKIWERTAEKKSTQMVFVDLSTPHNDGQFNVYDDLKKKLLDKGIPETEIAYIHDAKTEAAKKELFGKVRSGEIRVLIGSTQKMGAGTNAQRKLIALHHMDCRATRS